MIATPLIMDSGATFLYNKYIKKDTQGPPGTHMKDKRNVDFSFYKGKIFKDFRESYIKFIKKSSGLPFPSKHCFSRRRGNIYYKSRHKKKP